MRGRAVAALLSVMLLVACGSEPASAPDVAEPTVSDGSASTSPSDSDAGAASSPAPSVAPDVDTAPVLPPTTSSTTESSIAPATVPPEPPRDLLNPGPSTAIDWNTVGPGWVLFSYAVPDVLDDPSPEYHVTLMLLGPADEVYEVGQLPGPYPTGHRIRDLARDGRTALMSTWDDGENFWLLDLPTMSPTPYPAPETAWDARFSDLESSLLVEERFTTAQPSGGSLLERITLSRASLDGSAWSTLVDLPTTPDLGPGLGEFSFVALPTGELATIEAGTARLRSHDGQLLRELQLPSQRCLLVKSWTDDQVLAWCADPSAEPDCWTSGLFVIATDGGLFDELAMPTSTGEASACYATYSDAVVLRGRIALERGEGEGECTQRVEITDGTLSSTWRPADVDPCDTRLIGIRNDAWLVHVAPYEGAGVLYEVDAQGHSRPLTPTTLPESWNFPGITAGSVHIIGS